MDYITPDDLSEQTDYEVGRILDGDVLMGIGMCVDVPLGSLFDVTPDENSPLTVKILKHPRSETVSDDCMREMQTICRNEGYLLVCSRYCYIFGDDPNQLTIAKSNRMVLIKPFVENSPYEEQLTLVDEQIKKFADLKKYWDLDDVKFVLQYYWENEIIIDEKGLIYAEIEYESAYEHYEKYGDHEDHGV